MSCDKPYEVSIPFKEFCDRFFTSENATDGPWGDAFVRQTFSKYITDAAPHGLITIAYTYGHYADGYVNIKWRVKYTDKVYRVRYRDSTQWAAWWCSLTDALEEAADEECDEECEECDEEESDDEGKHKSECGVCGTDTSGRKIRSLWNNTLCEICGEESDDESDDDSVCFRVAHEYNKDECSDNCPYKSETAK